MLKHIFTIATLTIATVLCACSSHYPVDTSGRDVLEMESVWQYLKAYSIWQAPWQEAGHATLVADVFNPDTFKTPEQILESVNDTLGCWDPTFHYPQYANIDNYTGYCDSAGHLLAKKQVVIAIKNFFYVDSLTQNTVHLFISSFDTNTIFEDFSTIVPVLSRFSNIIIDLRYNGGGDITAVDSILQFFLPPQTPFLIATRRNYDDQSRTASTVTETWKTNRSDTTLIKKKLAILMNTGSASASEMLIAGLKDGRKTAGLDTVTLIGEKSYGKAMGQIILDRSYLGKKDIKITFLRVRRTDSTVINADYHRKGIVPDLSIADESIQLDSALHRLEPSAPHITQSLHKSSSAGSGMAYIRIKANPAFEK